MRAIAACRRRNWCSWLLTCWRSRNTLVLSALDLELVAGTVVADTVGERPCVFLSGLYRAEQVIAERLRCLIGGQVAVARYRS